MEKAVRCQREGAQAVACPGVDSGLVDDQLGRKRLEGQLQRLLESGEVGGVTSAFGQGHIEVTGGLAKRVVFGAVHRQGEDAGIFVEDDGGSVSLVYVAVHHHRALDPPLGLQRADGHTRVVEQAESTALVGVRVMGSAGEVHPATVLERGARARKCRLRCGAPGWLGRPGKPIRRAALDGRVPWMTACRYSEVWASSSQASMTAGASARDLWATRVPPLGGALHVGHREPMVGQQGSTK